MNNVELTIDPEALQVALDELKRMKEFMVAASGAVYCDGGPHICDHDRTPATAVQE